MTHLLPIVIDWVFIPVLSLVGVVALTACVLAGQESRRG